MGSSILAVLPLSELGAAKIRMTTRSPWTRRGVNSRVVEMNRELASDLPILRGAMGELDPLGAQ